MTVKVDPLPVARTCKLVDWRLWERALIGRLARLVLVLGGRSGQMSLQLLVLLPLLLLRRDGPSFKNLQEPQREASAFNSSTHTRRPLVFHTRVNRYELSGWTQ